MPTRFRMAGMTVSTPNSRSVGEMHSAAALVVLGMHRSGTSAVTGALRLCGAWVGDESELTVPNEENPQGFWERRDIRRVCDRLLHTAGAEWWKVMDFDLSSIPRATLDEQRQEFASVVSNLNHHRTWVIKEPRLCLLLPVLRDYLSNPSCIHIYRNPLEVARSLQTRNGFGIAGGIALWEAYNRRALDAAESVPRVLVSHESLMLHPVETLAKLLERLEALGVTHLARPDEDDVRRFISPALYRCKATEEEAYEFLTPSQRVLWQKLRTTNFADHRQSIPASRVARQNLLDLESSQSSIDYHKETMRRLAIELGRRDKTIQECDKTIQECDKTIQECDKTIQERDKTIQERDKTIQECDKTIQECDKTIQDSEREIRSLKQRAKDLNAQLTKRTATIHEVLESNSWKITAPLRTVVRVVRRICKYVRQIPRAARQFLASKLSKFLDTCIPTYNRFVPSYLDVVLRKLVYDRLVRHLLYQPSHASSPSAPITTYILSGEWCERHPESVQSIIRSEQAIIVVGDTDLVRNANATTITGPFGKALALASVSTETAIHITDEASARATAWPAWRRAAEEAEEREHRGVRLLSAFAIARALSQNQRGNTE